MAGNDQRMHEAGDAENGGNVENIRTDDIADDDRAAAPPCRHHRGDEFGKRCPDGNDRQANHSFGNAEQASDINCTVDGERSARGKADEADQQEDGNGRISGRNFVDLVMIVAAKRRRPVAAGRLELPCEENRKDRNPG